MTTEQEIAELPVAALDATVLDELCDTLGGQTDLIAGLYARFLLHTARHIDALRDPTNHAYITTLHTLKGSAAMMGAMRISALASRLHEARLRCAEHSIESGFEQLEDELMMFLHALAAHFPD